MPAINALLLGSLMYRSRLVPRIIPTLGLIGAPILIASVITTLFRVDHQITVLALGFLPVAAWEFSLGVWLAVKGFRPSPSPPQRPRPTAHPPTRTSAPNTPPNTAGPTKGPARFDPTELRPQRLARDGLAVAVNGLHGTGRPPGCPALSARSTRIRGDQPDPGSR